MFERTNSIPLQTFSRAQFIHSNFVDDEIGTYSSYSDETSDDDTSKPNFIKFESNFWSQSFHWKKKVRFADDCGKTLVMVRIIDASEELEDFCPNIIDSFFIWQYQNVDAASYSFTPINEKCREFIAADNHLSDGAFPKNKHATWKINFAQPASEYIKFRDTLEKNKVALENVILRNHQCKMLGTIKIANISFEKRVFVRLTFDSWKSFSDCPATWQSSFCKEYDTFAFEINIPMDEGDVTKIEICVCCIVNGTEYWDSNNGKNYSLISEKQQSNVVQQCGSLHNWPNNDCIDNFFW